jgi:hypothetical protein
MLRMDRYPYSRFWAIWDNQELVAVVVYKKGAAELLRRLQAPAPPASAGVTVPAAPTATERPSERQRAAQQSRRLVQGSHGSRSTAIHGRRSTIPCAIRDTAAALRSQSRRHHIPC